MFELRKIENNAKIFLSVIPLATILCMPIPIHAQKSQTQLQQLIQSADKAAHKAQFQTRTESQLRKSLKIYQQVIELDPTNRHSLNRLSLVYFTLAEAYLKDGEEKIQVYNKGYRYGLKSLRTNPDFDKFYNEKGFSALKDIPKSVVNIEGLFWTAANLGRTAESDGVLESLNKLPALVSPNRKILELDEEYLGGAAHRMLGSISAEVLKRMPFTLPQKLIHGFSWKKTKAHFDKAIESAPNCLENYFYYAKYYALNKGKTDEARKLLKKVLEEPLGNTYPLVNTIAKKKAVELLKEI